MAWIDGMNWAWNNFTAGNYFSAITLSYTNVMGMWFYAIVMFIGMIMIYLKTQDFGTVLITGLVISAAAVTFMPSDAQFFISIMTAFGIALILYKVFHK